MAQASHKTVSDDGCRLSLGLETKNGFTLKSVSSVISSHKDKLLRLRSHNSESPET